MAHFVLGIDVDGILADFTTGYIKMLERVSDNRCTLGHGEEPPCWYWADKCGFTKADEGKAWEAIKADPRFWLGLPAYVEAAPALTVLSLAQAEGHEVYFMTNRPGIDAHKQTVSWLQFHGMTRPQVLICPEIPNPHGGRPKRSSKGILALGLGITHLIDDKEENCFDVAIDSPTTRVVMRARRWNRDCHPAAIDAGMDVVTNLESFFDLLAAAEENATYAQSR